jgi:hypothetical protein
MKIATQRFYDGRYHSRSKIMKATKEKSGDMNGKDGGILITTQNVELLERCYSDSLPSCITIFHIFLILSISFDVCFMYSLLLCIRSYS